MCPFYSISLEKVRKIGTYFYKNTGDGKGLKKPHSVTAKFIFTNENETPSSGIFLTLGQGTEGIGDRSQFLGLRGLCCGRGRAAPAR